MLRNISKRVLRFQEQGNNGVSVCLLFVCTVSIERSVFELLFSYVQRHYECAGETH